MIPSEIWRLAPAVCFIVIVGVVTRICRREDQDPKKPLLLAIGSFAVFYLSIFHIMDVDSSQYSSPDDYITAVEINGLVMLAICGGVICVIANIWIGQPVNDEESGEDAIRQTQNLAERIQDIKNALSSKDEVDREWAQNEIEHLPPPLKDEMKRIVSTSGRAGRDNEPG